MKLDELEIHSSVAKFLRAAPRTGPKIATTDIETFPMLSYHWRMWKQNISTVMNLQDVTLMSYAFKWLEQPDAYYQDNKGASRRPGGMRDDTAMLRNLHKILSTTDMIVAQNGKRFDLPQIKGRMAIMGMEPLAPVKVIDTMVHNKNEFAFSSNSLAHLSPKFSDEAKTEHKEFPGFHLWLECLGDNPAAWAECRTYNLIDVTSTEEMYLKLRGWYQGHHNVGPYYPNPGHQMCSVCGGKVHFKGTRKTQVGIYVRTKCIDCGHWDRGRVLVANRDERSHILMS